MHIPQIHQAILLSANNENTVCPRGGMILIEGNTRKIVESDASQMVNCDGLHCMYTTNSENAWSHTVY